jgi:hypothetical protein
MPGNFSDGSQKQGIHMNIQRFFLVPGLLLLGVSISAGGCLLGSDPNKNSTLFGGGTTGSAGAGGPGGAAGTSGNYCNSGPVPGTIIAGFDTNTESFALDTYHDTAQINLNDIMAPANPPPALTFDATQGGPTAGSLSVTAPYSGANQYVDLQKTFGTASLQNWTGKTVHACIKVTQGTFKGGVQFYVKTGATYYFAGTYTTFPTGSGYQEFRLNVDAPMMIGPGTGTYDAAHVVSVGMQLNSSGAGLTQMPVTFSIDSFSITPPFPVVDAGSDALPAVTDTGAPSNGDAAGN